MRENNIYSWVYKDMIPQGYIHRMKYRIFGAVIVTLIGLSGCAGTTVKRVKDDTNDSGIRYYQASPYLLVHTDNQGGLTTELLYLPDLDQKFSIKPYNFLAKNNTTLSFTHGVLNQAINTVDTTAVPKAVISSLEKVATAAVNAALNEGAPSGSTTVPPPYLFKVVRKDDKWILLGGPGKQPDGNEHDINVTVSKPTE